MEIAQTSLSERLYFINGKTRKLNLFNCMIKTEFNLIFLSNIKQNLFSVILLSYVIL